MTILSPKKIKGTIFLTGVAGFIGFHTALKLLESGYTVLGIDSLSAYYSVQLKKDRLQILKEKFPDTFRFVQASLEDKPALEKIWASSVPKITHVIHLAAQAGVRYSLEQPYEYITTNIMGNLVLYELARWHGVIENFVYASSASVYGSNPKLPFSENDPTDSPISLYGATKKTDELMAHTYAHLFRIPMIGLRFFSVYGPWGRPDMALFLFTEKILRKEPIQVFNYGKMERDFTYVDDIVDGICKALHHPPQTDTLSSPYAVYNLGNSKIEPLLKYIQLIEENLGIKAIMEMMPMQLGDIPKALSDTTKAGLELGYKPTTNIETGIKNFIMWYKEYYKV